MTEHISTAEIKKLYDTWHTPSKVIAHCRAVARIGVRLAGELNKHGYSLDLELIRATGLVHDVARTAGKHDLVGFDILKDMGYDEEANIVKVHMSYPEYNPVDKLNECDIVCVADRVVKEDRYVGLDERIEYIISKTDGSPEIRRKILNKKEETAKFLLDISKIIGMTVDELFADELLKGRKSEELKKKLNSVLKRVEKPGRYIGGEVNSIIKNPEEVSERLAFCFPDLYEIGMSYLGMQILYDAVNKHTHLWCERAFAPAGDMEELMRKEALPLYTLESKTPLKEMDMIGFTLQYEMSYTTILNMLELSGIPLLSRERDDEYPIIAAGGPCAFNPEPLADFIDVFLIGDGEELLPQIMELHSQCRKKGISKEDFLKKACLIEGVYVPAFYKAEYNEDGTIKKLCKLQDEAPDYVLRRILPDIEDADFPVTPVIPVVEAVHDRSVVETFRGCTRGCRFCQAGMIYRPVRERSTAKILELAKAQLEATGNDELSLLSLSSSDHSDFRNLTLDLMDYCMNANVSLSLPSLRIDNFAFEVLNRIQEYKKSGLTYAPEAGTQRLRNVINKGVTEEDIFTSVEQALMLGWRHIKLYFMIGLPSETYEDLDGIVDIAQKIVDINKKYNGPKGGRFRLTVSVSNFVPKADTPFQWEPQERPEEFEKKHRYLEERLRIKGVTFNYHDSFTSVCEAVFARGDRRTGKALIKAHRLGCRLDGWREYFDESLWKKAFDESGISSEFYAYRKRDTDEILPWAHIKCGVDDSFFVRELTKARSAETTPDCRTGCCGCGINKIVKCKAEGIYGK